MESHQEHKSSPEQLAGIFDAEVENFTDVEQGQRSFMDAALLMELVSSAAAAVSPQAEAMLDVGCGAGNYTLRVLGKLPGLDCTLLDISENMLEKARARVGEATSGRVNTIQANIFEAELPQGEFDIAVAGAALHHLREDDQWQRAFENIYRSIKPGGSFWIADVVTSRIEQVQQIQKHRHRRYLEKVGGPEYRDRHEERARQNDTPRPLIWQLDLMRGVGFEPVDVLHRNCCFAAFGGIKPVG